MEVCTQAIGVIFLGCSAFLSHQAVGHSVPPCSRLNGLSLPDHCHYSNMSNRVEFMCLPAHQLLCLVPSPRPIASYQTKGSPEMIFPTPEGDKIWATFCLWEFLQLEPSTHHVQPHGWIVSVLFVFFGRGVTVSLFPRELWDIASNQ